MEGAAKKHRQKREEAQIGEHKEESEIEEQEKTKKIGD
jgi:hypothetical protein